MYHQKKINTEEYFVLSNFVIIFTHTFLSIFLKDHKTSPY